MIRHPLAHLSKAKRRLGNDHGLLICVHTYSAALEGSIGYAMDFRVLIKE
jgi:hypothetical protein